MYDLKGYSDDYLKTSGSLWQYYKDVQPLNNVAAIADFADNNLVFHLHLKEKWQIKKVIMAQKMLEKWYHWNIHCEINFSLMWSENCVIPSSTSANEATTFVITDTKLYTPV